MNAFIKQNEPFIRYLTASIGAVSLCVHLLAWVQLRINEVETNAAIDQAQLKIAQAELETRAVYRLLDRAFPGNYNEFIRELDEKIEARATAAAEKALAAAMEHESQARGAVPLLRSASQHRARGCWLQQ